MIEITFLFALPFAIGVLVISGKGLESFLTPPIKTRFSLVGFDRERSCATFYVLTWCSIQCIMLIPYSGIIMHESVGLTLLRIKFLTTNARSGLIPSRRSPGCIQRTEKTLMRPQIEREKCTFWYDPAALLLCKLQYQYLHGCQQISYRLLAVHKPTWHSKALRSCIKMCPPLISWCCAYVPCLKHFGVMEAASNKWHVASSVHLNIFIHEETASRDSPGDYCRPHGVLAVIWLFSREPIKLRHVPVQDCCKPQQGLNILQSINRFCIPQPIPNLLWCID